MLFTNIIGVRTRSKSWFSTLSQGANSYLWRQFVQNFFILIIVSIRVLLFGTRSSKKNQYMIMVVFY
jgi:hypothetical protein